MCHELDCSKIQLYTRFDEPLTEEVLAPLREKLKLRGEGVPIQHLMGSVEFYRREFKSDARALIPRPETEELVEIVLQEIAKYPITANSDQPLSILDMGCGSGIIGLTLAAELERLNKPFEVTCIDTSEDAIMLAKENMAQLEIKNVTFKTGNLFSNSSDSYDIIVANLPYVPETDRSSLAPELSHDPDLALFGGADGLDIIKTFLQQSQTHRNNHAIIALEIGIGQDRQVEQLLSDAGYTDINTHIDLSGIARFPVAHFIANS